MALFIINKKRESIRLLFLRFAFHLHSGVRTVDLISLGTLLFFLLGSAFFSSSETAIMSISLARARVLAKEKGNKGRLVLELKEKLDDTLIAILLGNNLANIGATAIATGIFLELLSSMGIAFATAVMTIIILTFGEIFPKLYASSKSEDYLLAVIMLLYDWVWLSTPFVTIYKEMSDWMKKQLAITSSPRVTEDEIEEMVKLGVVEGEVAPNEKEIILRALDFADTTARAVMVPISEVFAVEENTTLEELLEQMKVNKVTHTRIPIFRKKREHIVGVVNIKEMLRFISIKDGWKEKRVKALMRSPLFVFCSDALPKVLTEMKRQKQFLAICLREKKVVKGVIAIKDILEDLVGEMYDELDEVAKDYKAIGKDKYLFRQSLSLEYVGKILHIKFSGHEEKSIGEFIEEKSKGKNRLVYKGFVFTLLPEVGKILVKKAI